MIIEMSPANRPEEPDVWQTAGFAHKGRRANLPRGFRLYSGTEWLRTYRDTDRPAQVAGLEDCGFLALTPEAEAARWLDEEFLDDLINGSDVGEESCRYMSASERVRRLAQISASRTSFVCRRPHGIPVFLENHGPTIEWLEDAREKWAALPANDSEIFKRPAETENPKHAKLATDFAPLLQWARMSKRRWPLSTNWLQPDNDNYDGEEEQTPKPAKNRERRIRPGSSYKELRSCIAKAGPLTVRKFGAKLDVGGSWELVPTDSAYPARAGKLHIANGATEVAGERG